MAREPCRYVPSRRGALTCVYLLPPGQGISIFLEASMLCQHYDSEEMGSVLGMRWLWRDTDIIIIDFYCVIFNSQIAVAHVIGSSRVVVSYGIKYQIAACLKTNSQFAKATVRRDNRSLVLWIFFESLFRTKQLDLLTWKQPVIWNR